MAGFASSLGFAVLTVTLSAVILAIVVAPPTLTPTASHIKLNENRRSLSFDIIGDRSRSNCIIWLHGVISSRYEALGLDKGILRELDAYVISYDRAGYGESTTLRRRNLRSEVEDIESLADALGVDKFFITAVSGGSPYALAAAALIPARLRGILLLSAAGSPGVSDAPIVAQELSAKHPRLSKALEYPWLIASARWLAETYAGGRALYAIWLQDLASGILSKFSEVDRRCIMREHKNSYLLKNIPESTKQATATALVQDMLNIALPWSIDVTAIPEALQSATHIWHGTDDNQVPHANAHKYKAVLPKATLTIIEGGGHMAYWACNKEQQKQALAQLFSAGLPA